MENNQIEPYANSLLGKETIDDLKSWYKELIKAEYVYVVFMVRRSYNLALLLEKITNQKMKNTSCFLTDSSFMLYIDALADTYRITGRFPTICIADDVLIYGRNIGFFLKRIEDCTIKKLQEPESDDARYAVRKALVDAVNIEVCFRNDGQLLLKPDYRMKLSYQKNKPQVLLRKISSDISTFILDTGIANASYIYSDCISASVFEKINLDNMIQTRYQGTEQYSCFDFSANSMGITAIYSIRVVPDKTETEYRVIPCVFLPELAGNELTGLWHLIEKKMKKVHVSNDICMKIQKWMNVDNIRNFNEFISMVMSCSVLYEFEKKYQLAINRIRRTEELNKLVRNYNQFDSNETFRLLEMVTAPDFLPYKELKTYLNDLLALSDNCLPEIATASNQIKSPWNGVDNQLLDDMEDVFYGMGTEEEIDAYQKTKSENVFRMIPVQRTADLCWDVLRHLLQKKKEGEIGQRIYVLAYFLMMMDAGVLSLSVYPPSSHLKSDFSQFVKAGEQSLVLGALYFLEYIPMLVDIRERVLPRISFMEENPEEKYWSLFQEELGAYLSWPKCDVRDKAEQIEKFVDRLNKMGHMPADWNNSYLLKLDKRHVGGETGPDMLRFLARRQKHRENYNAFCME